MKKILILFFIFIIPLLLLMGADNYFGEKANLYLEKEITNTISNVISDAISQSNILNESSKLLILKENPEGKISSIYIDSVKTNKIIASMNEIIYQLLQDGILEESIKDIKLPLGMLTSKALFTNIGPYLRIEVLPVTSYKTDLETNLVNYGINNSLFEIYLKLKIEVETIIPLRQTKIDYESKLLLASTIIQGEVPYYYYLGEGTIQSLPL